MEWQKENKIFWDIVRESIDKCSHGKNKSDLLAYIDKINESLTSYYLKSLDETFELIKNESTAKLSDIQNKEKFMNRLNNAKTIYTNYIKDVQKINKKFIISKRELYVPFLKGANEMILTDIYLKAPWNKLDIQKWPFNNTMDNVELAMAVQSFLGIFGKFNLDYIKIDFAYTLDTLINPKKHTQTKKAINFGQATAVLAGSNELLNYLLGIYSPIYFIFKDPELSSILLEIVQDYNINATRENLYEDTMAYIFFETFKVLMKEGEKVKSKEEMIKLYSNIFTHYCEQIFGQFIKTLWTIKEDYDGETQLWEDAILQKLFYHYGFERGEALAGLYYDALNTLKY
ncbi:hypothetical protein [Mycoplasmopsis adleri]|uniref:hypothetical protein n=1 Tax=Mycoplasmopsis adleri TaxID=51362 RepID=UPI003872CCE1